MEPHDLGHTGDECRQGRAEAQRGLSRLQIWRGYYYRLTCCAHIATEARFGTDGIRPGGGSDLRRQIQQLLWCTRSCYKCYRRLKLCNCQREISGEYDVHWTESSLRAYQGTTFGTRYPGPQFHKALLETLLVLSATSTLPKAVHT